MINEYEKLLEENIRLRNNLRYYQGMMCLMPPKRYYAVKDGDAIAEIDTQRVVDILEQNKTLKISNDDLQMLLQDYKIIVKEYIALLSEQENRTRVLSEEYGEVLNELARVKGSKSKLNLAELERLLDEALANETVEGLTEWLQKQHEKEQHHGPQG